jgi:S-adenosylmethionine hydrolase
MVSPPSGVVVYMSDFGWSDPYAGIVRGVIDRLSDGRVKVIDLTHDIESFNILAGAYVLYTSYRYFRRGSTFLVVIDPGVGTRRRPVVIVTRNYYFVGPDNGVMYPAAYDDGIEAVYVISNEAVYLKPVSMSFHGRDIFAPAATLIALGVNPASLGDRIRAEDLVKLKLRESCRAGPVKAKVVYVDRFGNVALGLEKDCVEKLCSKSSLVKVITPSGTFAAKCYPVFSHARPGELVFYLNSLGFPELAVNLGSAASRLGVRVGDEVLLSSG